MITLYDFDGNQIDRFPDDPDYNIFLRGTTITVSRRSDGSIVIRHEHVGGIRWADNDPIEWVDEENEEFLSDDEGEPEPPYHNENQCFNCGKEIEKTNIHHYCSYYCFYTRSGGILSFDFQPPLTFLGNPPSHYKNLLYYGVEYEMFIDRSLNRLTVADQMYKKFADEIFIKHDGSLRDPRTESVMGFEVVTQPMSFSYQKEFWGRFFAEEFPYTSYEHPECGIHVHMSRSAISPIQLVKMINFVYHPNNAEFIRIVAGRNLNKPHHNGRLYAETLSGPKPIREFVKISGGRKEAIEQIMGTTYSHLLSLFLGNRQVLEKYLSPKKEEIDAYVKKHRLQMVHNIHGRHDHRYTAVNTINRDTIEFRIFKGCNRLSTMLKNIEFCQALYEYTLNCSLKDIENHKPFIEFCRSLGKEFSELNSFIKKYWDGRSKVEKSPSKEEEERKITVEEALRSFEFPRILTTEPPQWRISYNIGSGATQSWVVADNLRLLTESPRIDQEIRGI